MELEVIIGLEIHAQLNTKTKLFSRSDNDAFNAEPNTRVNEVDMGFPGMLPVINREAVIKGARGGAALGGKIQEFSKFDRKNYFYPDLPMGYQISQFDKPIVQGGQVDIEINGELKKIGITRVHLENDAGKLSHNAGGTFCDYNRAGTPLVEIVTEPDIRSAEEAQTLAREIQKILRFVDASDADMEKGMMRFDASISMRPMGDTKLYPRSEIKNLNSFSSLQKALKYEINRQRKLWKEGNPSTQETTVGWIDDEERTQLLRDKESAHDYRYFPEPDLPPLTFTKEEIKAIEDSIPELPLAKCSRYKSEFGLNDNDALKLSESLELSSFFESTASAAGDAKKAANMILSVVLAHNNWKESAISPELIAQVIKEAKSGRISSSGAKEIITHIIENIKDAETQDLVSTLITELGLEQSSDSGEMEKWCDEVLAANPQSVEDFKAGKEKALAFLMGQVMKMSKGQANPAMASEILRKKM